MILVMLMAAWVDAWVKIKVSPSGLFAGQAITVTCTVPRHPDNRYVRIGLAEVSDSILSTDDRITYTRIIKEVPCGARVAYCQVQRANGDVQEVAATIAVLGCDEGGL